MTVSNKAEWRSVIFLPSYAEQSPMEAPEEEMEYEFPRCEEPGQHGTVVCPHCDE
jgi:hypothetical protein